MGRQVISFCRGVATAVVQEIEMDRTNTTLSVGLPPNTHNLCHPVVYPLR